MTARISRYFAFSMLLLMFGGMIACSPLVRERTLPPSIRSVYIPMIINRTQEPGLEEELTEALQWEVMADGRLNVVSKKHADATIEVILTGFNDYPFNLDDNDFGVVKVWELRGMIYVYENVPGRPIVGEPRDFTLEYGFNDDPRTTTFDPEPRQKEKLADLFAKTAVLEILLGGDDEELEDKVIRTNPRRSIPDTDEDGFGISS